MPAQFTTVEATNNSANKATYVPTFQPTDLYSHSTTLWSTKSSTLESTFCPTNQSSFTDAV